MRGIAIPIAFQIMAILFSPLGLAVSSVCTGFYYNNQNCSLVFNSGASIAFTTSGYSYNAVGAVQQCKNVQIGGITIGQVPIIGFLASLPILSNIANFFIGLGQSFQAQILGSATAVSNSQACLTATGVLFIFKYDGQDLVLLFISAILTAAIITALTGLTVAGTGINTGAVYTIFIVSSLSLIWLILTGFALPTWSTIPSPYGATIYTFITLSYALSIVGVVGGTSIGGIFED